MIRKLDAQADLSVPKRSLVHHHSLPHATPSYHPTWPYFSLELLGHDDFPSSIHCYMAIEQASHTLRSAEQGGLSRNAGLNSTVVHLTLLISTARARNTNRTKQARKQKQHIIARIPK